ncbi:hypothetical protein Glove_134g248 [Diversispora epigaea]|uniref:Dipeptidyl-peptidase IV n=1 Tax=Diversispora epigaea TaxID=1348612 RepID=A0A397IX99_9GLOM|nr:hypothetical protein Glove_134g248 [Diversispora epigaea]
MRITKYDSLPSKESEVERSEYINDINLNNYSTRDLSEAGESSSSESQQQQQQQQQWTLSEKKFQDNEEEEVVNFRQEEKMEGEEKEIMLKERGEDDTVVDVEETWDGEEGYTKRSKRERSILPCLIIAGIFIFAWVGSAVLYAYYRSSISSQSTLSRIKFGDVYNGSFYPSYTSLVWSTTDGDDGQYIYRSGDSIVVQSAKDNSKTILVDGTYISELKYFSFSVSPDNQYVLLGANKTKGWRYSFTANYYIFNISSKETLPITTPIDTTHQVIIAQAKWSSVGHSLAFVKDNDLYISVDLKEEIRVTYDGSTVVFNGVPDWIYEEEVLANNFAFWWSPNATQIAYLRLNESLVPEYRFPLYLNGMLATPYAKEVIMKYPKPGYPNPVVTFHIYDTSTPLISQSAAIPFTNDFADTDKIITEVCWAGNDNVLVRVMNRVQDIARVVLVNAGNRSGITVREENAETKDGGWFEITRSMVYLNKSGGITQDSYVDVVVNNGYNHLAIFSPLNNGTPKYLTSGNWEVVGGVKAVDYTLKLAYFMSTEKSSIERHLYSVTLDGLTKTALTNTDEAGYYEVSFSKGAKYYNIKYEGPEIPWQKVLKVDNSSFSVSLQDNNKLKSLIKTIDMPTIKYSTVESDGNQLNVMEIRPPGMDETGREKYPVLFHVYGGPTSQLVNKKFFFDWHLYVASKLKFVVVTVDTRGTGYLGRKFRVCVRKHLGEYESIDSINTAKLWAKLPYVDSSKIAIWGWSFGGFLTSKVIEADSGIFQVGMAVAPVTDWRFYDSIYTERYMKTPTLNFDGYEKAAVTNMTGFSHAQFLLAHGTGDDNVHFLNSANLVDKFTLASVHNYRLQFYTDNDHSITKHNANRELYYLLTEYLWQNFGNNEKLDILN